MGKKIKKRKRYTTEEGLPESAVEEPAVQYRSLRFILGGGPSFKPISGDFDLISLSRAGIKKSSLRSLAGYLGISMDTMGKLLHTSSRNLQRKDDEEMLDTLKTEKVLELAAFVQRGIEVIGNKSAFIDWLHSPVLSLGNKAPIDFLDTSFGIQMVTKILGRLEQGVYS